MNSLSQKKFPAIIILLCMAALFAFSVIRPAVDYIKTQFLFYRTALTETFPTIIFRPEGGIDFIGDIPTIITLQDSVQIFVDHQPNDSLFADAKYKSVFLSSEELWYKKQDGTVWQADLGFMESDDSTKIEPLQLNAKIVDYSSTATLVAFTGFTLIFFIFLWLLALFGGGIGIMIDAFHVGCLNYTQSVNLASLWLLLYTILFIYVPLQIKVLSFFVYFLLYILSVAVCVFLLNTLKANAMKQTPSD